MNKFLIGVDTGGTFTDFVIYRNGKFDINKIPSTPKNPSIAILEGLKGLISSNGSPIVIHGTTVATNALLERKGGRIALITTKGFEDILFIGRQTRKKLYSLKGEKRVNLLPRKRCFGVEEKINHLGKVKKKPSLKEIEEILRKIKKDKVEAVAVSLINSYANPSNEKIIENQLRKQNLLSSISSDILPEYREYERTALTSVNAYLIPVVVKYLSDLEEKISSMKLRIMQSNEGYISPSVAKSEPIRTALSGPAGGVVAAFHMSKASGFKNVITLDMGGTSSDVSLIDGKIRRTQEGMIGNFPVRLPLIDIHTVGAGGGSIAYVDRGGSLRVGPQSAGAKPGPACYGQAMIPTVTDANLALGRLVPEFFLGGRMKIFPQRSIKALENIAKKINKSPIDTAEGIIEIANAIMEKAIRVISIERGFDTRNFILFSFGGAGGIHAAEISSHLKMAGVIVPKNAGVLSALGLLLADSIKDYSLSVLKTQKEITQREIEKSFADLFSKGLKDMKKEGFKKEDIKIFPSVDLRYLGQSYEITIPFNTSKPLDPYLISNFHKAHKKLYSYCQTDTPVEIVNIRVKAVGSRKKIKLNKYPVSNTNPKKAFLKKQRLFYKGKKYNVSIFKRPLLQAGNVLNGPALVADYESTTFLPPSFTLKVDQFLNLIIHKE